MNQVDKKYLILGSLCALVLMLVVGYAAFSTILNIKGTSNISSNWDVKITNIERTSYKGATDNEGSPSYDNTNGLSATFNTNFTTPGDYATYKIEITNNGSLDAVLKTITMPENTNNDILFYLNKNQNNEDITESLKQNDTLFKKGETGNVGYVYVTVLYKDYEGQITPTKENATVNMTITFDFEQADTAVEPEPDPEPGFTGTVYRYSSDKLNIGDSIEGITTSETKPSLQGTVFYLKHDVVDNKITASYVCFTSDSEHCIQGGADHYASNKALLQANQSYLGSCKDNTSNYYCSSDRWTHIYVYSDGHIEGQDNARGCSIDTDGASYC